MHAPDGHLLLLLHAHLPFIRHPEDPHFIEEGWLCEAITECYVPLLHRLERLHEDGIGAALTMTWTPPLCEMLADPLLHDRWRTRTTRLLDLAEREVAAKAGTPFAGAAVMYRDHYRFCLGKLAEHGGNLLHWVRQLADAGVIEPITCTATHGFLPLILSRECRRAQVEVAVACHTRHFGRPPRAIWLAECGYAPDVEDLLAAAGISAFFVDSHGLAYGEPPPRFGVYAPVRCANGVAAFARDPESSRSVWSRESGYPGDPLYREYYRDLGYDGDYAYVRPFLHPDGVRRNLGLKYHRVTGNVALHEKAPYDPVPAHARAMDHAAHFVAARQRQAQSVRAEIGQTALLVAPYDAELFGHWWFEGPQFIESIFRCVHDDPQQRLVPVTVSDHLATCVEPQLVTPCASSWGDGGYNGVWLNPANDWIYRHHHEAEARMVDAVRRHPHASGQIRAALAQLGRELLLLQSSDWAFIMTTGTTVPYATRRVRDHINRFTALYEQLCRGDIDARVLHEIAWRDTIFPDLDPQIFAG